MPQEVVVKCKKADVLTKSIVDECDKYRYQFFPENMYIAIGPKTEASKEVRAYAAKRKVKIKRLRF